MDKMWYKEKHLFFWIIIIHTISIILLKGQCKHAEPEHLDFIVIGIKESSGLKNKIIKRD